MAIPDKITTNPEVYAGKWSAKGYDNDGSSPFWFENDSRLSGPNYYSEKNLKTFTNTAWMDAKDTAQGRMGKWYTLDLSRKYNTTSKLKQFHLLTFVFRNTKNANIGRLITSSLPEQLAYKIGGKWEKPIKLTGGSLINAVVQNVTGGKFSTTFAVDTTQVWMGTEPLEMVFKIPIFDDSGTNSGINYQEALDCFSEAILPELNSAGSYSNIPGPNILDILGGTMGDKNVWLQNQTKNVFDTFSDFIGDNKARRWDRITVQVGGILLMDWCIIKDIKVTFPNTKAMVLHDWTHIQSDLRSGQLHPLLAQIEVTVATAKGITRSNFKRMLQLQEDKVEKKTSDELACSTGVQVKTPAEKARDELSTVWSGVSSSNAELSAIGTGLSGIKSLIDTGRSTLGL